MFSAISLNLSIQKKLIKDFHSHVGETVVFKLFCDFLKIFQVVEIQEDAIEIEEDVSILTENIHFLFDEQIIQDERLLNLETETEGIEEEVEGLYQYTVVDPGDQGAMPPHPHPCKNKS